MQYIEYAYQQVVWRSRPDRARQRRALSKGLVALTACICVELPKTGASNQIAF